MSGRPTVLVVDDNDAFLSLMRSALEDFPVAVETAENSAVALEKIARLKPAVVFLDLMMPGCDGLETLERLPQGGAGDTRIVLFSVLFMVSDKLNQALERLKRLKEERPELASVDIADKPIGISAMHELVRRYLPGQII